MGYPLFFLCAVVLIAAAAGVVLNRHPVRSALCLVAAMCLLSVLFFALDAPFIGILQVIVYAGAIMVVFLFVIMLLNLQGDLAQRQRAAWQLATIVTASLFAGGLIYALKEPGQPFPGPTDTPLPAGFGSITAVAQRLFTHFVLPFEITGVLMLAAVVGAVVLAKRKVS